MANDIEKELKEEEKEVKNERVEMQMEAPPRSIRWDKMAKAGLLIIVVGALFLFIGYKYGKESGNEATETAATETAATTDDSATTIASASATASADAAADWRTYTNDTYGFSLTVASNWTGYRVFDWSADNADSAPAKNIYDVCLPTSNQTFDSHHPGYACPIKISAYPKATYESLSSEGGPGAGTKLGESNGKVLAYSMWQDSPDDVRAKGLDKEVDSVLSTFQFTPVK